jgi:hypothetical protein
LRIKLVPLASIRGRVLDPEGKPSVNATVEIDVAVTEQTNEKGEFSFTGLTPGSYTLKATQSATIPPPAMLPGDDRREVAPTWFPSAIESAPAEEITLAGGADLSGYVIRLQTTPVYRVHGLVLNVDGKPEPRARVSVVGRSRASAGPGIVARNGAFGYQDYFPIGGTGVSPSPLTEVATGPDGSFELPSVRAGNWYFIASVDGGAKSDLEFAPAEYASAETVIDRDLDDLRIRFAAPFAMRGTVEMTGAAAKSELPRFLVSLAPEDRPLGASGMSESDGTFRLPRVPPGRYRIEAPPSLDGGYYLASVLLGEQEVLGQAVNLFSGSPSIHLIYKPNGGTVRGTVGSRERTEIVLIPDEALSSSLAADFGHTVPCGSGNSFEIRGLRPGGYYAWAFSSQVTRSLNRSKMSDPERLRKLMGNAAVVRVEEGSATVLSLTASRGPE